LSIRDDHPAEPYLSRRANWNTHLERHALTLADHPAIRFEGKTTTWARLHHRVVSLADAFARRGVRFGDRVAVIMGNRPEFIETLLATTRLGAIAVPLNFRLTGVEAAHILADCGAVLVVADEIGKPIVQAAFAPSSPSGPVPRVLVVKASAAPFESYADAMSEAAAPREPANVPESSPALIMYTSGTTGRPKGAVLSHQNLQSQALTIIRAFRFGGEEEVNLIASPLFHIGALGSVVPTILVGGTIAVMPTASFSSTALLELLEDEGVTSVFLVPTQWQAVCDDPTVGTRNLDRLRTIAWGAAPASETLLRTMAETFPASRNVALFGQTEMSPVTCVLDGTDSVRKLGSVGKPIATVAARVVDPEMNDVTPGEVGEIVYRGPGLMQGYWDNPEATAEAFRGGWFHSGDLVRLDDEGYVYVVDRAKDMIISGGENIYCAEVENALAAHPLIADVGVVGRPHPVWGETPVAYVVLRDPDQGLDIESLRRWASGSVAKYKLPTRLEILPSLPRNASGKVLKGALRDHDSIPAAPPAP